MNQYDEDLKKYWYVRTSTLNKYTAIKPPTKKEQRIMRNKIIKREIEKKQRIHATKVRNSDYTNKIFKRHYWEINQCMICWAKGILHIHHKDKNRRNNKYTNLIKICISCHAKMHKSEKGWKFLENILSKIKK